MIRTELSMVAHPGREAEFVATWERYARHIADQPGNVDQVLMRDRGEPRRFVVLSSWSDEEALEEFRRSPLRGALSAALDGLRESADNAVLDTIATIPANRSTT